MSHANHLEVVHSPSSSTGSAGVLGLRCRECGRNLPSPRSTRASGASARSRSRTTTTRSRRSISREKIAAGPASLWRYADLLPVNCDPSVDLGTGFTPLVRADRLAAELGLGEVWIKNDTRNPTNSFKDRVVSGRARARRWSSASRSRPARLRATSPTPSPRTPRTRVSAATCSFPPISSRAKVVTTAVYGGNVVAIEGNYDDVNRLCAELAGIYDWAFVNVNMRPFYAEGSKTLAFETAEQLGWRTPDHVVVPGGQWLTAHEDPKGLQRAAPRRACSTTSRTCASRARRRSGARRSRPRSSSSPTRSGRSSPTRSPSRSQSATPPTATSRSTRFATAAAVSRRSPTTRSSRAWSCSRRTEGIFAETAGGVTIATLRKARGRRGDSCRRARRRLHHRPRIEDHRSRSAYELPNRHHRAEPRRVPRRVRHRGG